MSRLIDDLNELHDGFVAAINESIERGDVDGAHRLAAEYDEQAIEMIAVREGRTDLLPLRRPTRTDTPLRRLVARLSLHRVA